MKSITGLLCLFDVMFYEGKDLTWKFLSKGEVLNDFDLNGYKK
jgi:hypothetical protein